MNYVLGVSIAVTAFLWFDTTHLEVAGNSSQQSEFRKEIIENQKRIMQFQEDCKAGNYPKEVC